jgi:hypothetical protein
MSIIAMTNEDRRRKALELVDRITNTKLGWLPDIGDIVNVTFDATEALIIIDVLRASAEVRWTEGSSV